MQHVIDVCETVLAKRLLHVIGHKMKQLIFPVRRKTGLRPLPASPESIDGKRRPESLMSLWNQDELTIYTSATSNLSMNQLLSNLQYLFPGELTTDYRYSSLFNTTNKYYRVDIGQRALKAL